MNIVDIKSKGTKEDTYTVVVGYKDGSGVEYEGTQGIDLEFSEVAYAIVLSDETFVIIQHAAIQSLELHLERKE